MITNMKIINLIKIPAILLMLPLIAACSSDDDDDHKGNGGASDIVGNWFLYDEVGPLVKITKLRKSLKFRHFSDFYFALFHRKSAK